MLNIKDSPINFVGDGVTIETMSALASALTGYEGGVFFPAGNYIIDESIDLRGLSNITIYGEGKGVTAITCTAALDGSNANAKNDVFNINNLTTPVGSYPKNVTIRDLTIDASLQNATGVPGGATSGFNLCGIEFQNVDNAVARNVEVIGAFGNGVVFGSIDPTMTGAIRNPVMEDCDLTDCVRDILPQYGITGSVIQVGAALGGRINSNNIIRAGGPAIDAFNCLGTHFENNWINGISSTPFATGQTKGTFHSDFGLDSVFIKGNVSRNAGGFITTGLMVANAFNGNVPTPGIRNSTIVGNKVTGQGTYAYGSTPAVPASGVNITAPSVPILVTLSGGVSVVAAINGVNQRQSGATQKSFTAPPGSTIKLTYTSAPTWVWEVAPNILLPHYRFMGGSTATALGQAFMNDISENISYEAPDSAFMVYDGRYNVFERNLIYNCGHANGTGNAFSMMDSAVITGTGSKDNIMAKNRVVDTHGATMLRSNVQDNGANNTSNRYVHNRNNPTWMVGGGLYACTATLTTTDNY